MNTSIFCCASGTIANGHLEIDGTLFKVRGTPEIGNGIWSFVPITDSSGLITSLSDVTRIEELKHNYCVGRVTQFSKRGTALIKISEQCKLTVFGTHILKVGVMTELQLEIKNSQLHVVSADSNSRFELEVKHKETSTLINLDKNWAAKLELQIREEYPEIELLKPVIRLGTIEWDGKLQERKIRIQSTVGSQALSFHEFTNPNIDSEPYSEESKNITLKVTPLGAARSIGASCFKVEIGNYEIVLDAGTRPKGNNPLPAFEQLKNPNLILITHAHQDHIGALPVLHSMFPTAPMVCTPPTREIARVMLSDCLKVQQLNEDFEPLFNESELQQTLLHLETEPVDSEFEPLPGLKVRFINAGHIVGAACIHLKLANRSLLYTGDYNTANSRTTVGLKLKDLPTSDILITEATYGASSHSKRNEQESELVANIASIVKAGGNVLIPAFALGRAQEIILTLKTSPFFPSDIPVFLDGLVRAVTDVFAENLQFLPDTIRNLAKTSKTAPFADDIKVIPITDPKQRPLALAKPSVMIASSGMLTGGASVYYAQALLERENAGIFFSGYTDEESPGRLLQEMKTGEVITIDGRDYLVRAQVKKFNLSAHVDRVGIGQVIAQVKPKHLILIHGNSDALHDLATNSSLQKHYIVHIPGIGEVIEYGTFPEFITNNTKIALTHEKQIELEIVTEHDGAWIKVPKKVVDSDPRWQTLGMHSAVRAKWHHNTLVLLPITTKSIATKKAKNQESDCCAKCTYFKSGFCRSEESSLYEMPVDPYGICEEFNLIFSQLREKS